MWLGIDRGRRIGQAGQAIPLIALLILSLRKAPASLAVMGSALLAGVMAAILQPQTVLDS